MKAKKLLEVKQKLETQHSKVSPQTVADAANELGIKTTRDGTWSAATVRRALARLQTG